MPKDPELTDQVLKEMGHRLMYGSDALSALNALWTIVRQHEHDTGDELVTYTPLRLKIAHLTGIPDKD